MIIAIEKKGICTAFPQSKQCNIEGMDIREIKGQLE
jgi:hypothetical protein